jgi:tetratricopeptide (TPR) repeat protein
MRTAVIIVAASVMAFGCSRARTESISMTNKGIKAYQRHEVAEALTMFEGAVSMYPRNDQAHYQLGMILLHDKKNLEAADRELNEAAKINPKDAEIVFQLGRLALAKGDMDGALTRYQEAAKLDPGHVGAVYWMADILAQKGKLNEADDLFRKAIAIDPSYARSYSGLGTLYLEAGAEAEAMAVFREAIRLNPDDAEGHHNLGLTYLSIGNVDAAIEELTRSLELDPENLNGAFNLANALIRKQRLREAMFYLKKFIVTASIVGDRNDLIQPARLVLQTVQVALNEEGN